MQQFYLLTILFNAVTGYILAFCKKEVLDDNSFSFSLYNNGFRLLLGVCSMFTGLLKILSPMNGNIPVIGDLFPALANLSGGFILVFEFYRNRSTVNSEAAEKIGEITGKYRKLIGFIAIAAAVLHFIVFPVVFL